MAEAKKKDSGDTSSTKKLSDSMSDAAKRYNEESARYIKGYTLAYMEGMRLASTSFANMVGEIAGQVDPGETESTGDLLRAMPEKVAGGYSKALDEATEIPSKVVDKFYEAYSAKN